MYLENVQITKKNLLQKSHVKFVRNPEESFPIRLDKRKGGVAKPPDGSRSCMHRAALYLGRKFGERVERKRKLALRDERWRKREKGKRSEGMKTENA